MFVKNYWDQSTSVMNQKEKTGMEKESSGVCREKNIPRKRRNGIVIIEVQVSSSDEGC
jgi:hypothetical protein